MNALPTLLALVLATAAPDSVRRPPATPPGPGEGKMDWIQLPAGEWLAGEIKSMRNEEIEFDSDKLDVQKFDWTDIVQLRSPRTLTYAFIGRRVAVGTATIRDSTVRVTERGAVREFRRADLLGITEGKGDELSLWSGKLGAGLDASTGNTDQAEFNFRFDVRRDGPSSRFDVSYLANFGELGGIENVNNHVFGARLDQFLSRLVFITPIAVQLYSDRFQNIALRTTVGAGAGYYFVRRKSLEWFALAGGGYLSTRHRSVEAGQDVEESGGALTPAMSFEWDIVKDLELDSSYSATFRVPDLDDWTHHFVTRLSIENLKLVDLNTSVVWDRVARPVPREDGSVPQKDDLRTTFGISVEF